MNIQQELKEGGAVLKLIEKCFFTIIELDVSFCNLIFKNAFDLFSSLEALAQEDAEIYTNGIIKGSFRKLNLSYNSFRSDKISGKVNVSQT